MNGSRIIIHTAGEKSNNSPLTSLRGLVRAIKSGADEPPNATLTDLPDNTPTPESEKEMEKKREAQEVSHEFQDTRLRQLVNNNDELYLAMENFILGDPERQISELGDPKSIVSKGDEEKSRGEYIMARANYETAAKVEIYNQNKDGARKALLLAQEVTDESDNHHKYQETMLTHLDDVLRVANAYYNTVPRAHNDTT